MKEFNQYGKLFSSMFIISMFTFGGGFVIVPMFQKKFVDELQWIEKDEMLDLIAIAQAAPGILTVNAAILLGRRIGGIKGSLIAPIGTLIPPFIIMGVISYFYSFFESNDFIQFILNGMQGAVAAVIISVAISMLVDITKFNKTYNIIIFIVAFTLSFIVKISVVYLIFGSLLLAIIKYFIAGGSRNVTS